MCDNQFEVVQGLLNNQPRAYQCLRECYTRSTARPRQDGASEAECIDLFEEAVYILVCRICENRYDPERGSCCTFLYETILRLWMERIRRHKRVVSLEAVDWKFWASDTDIQAQMESSERRLALAHAIEKLGSDCRQLIRQRYFEAESIENIMKVNGLSSKEYTSLKIHRCLQQLKALTTRIDG